MRMLHQIVAAHQAKFARLRMKYASRLVDALMKSNLDRAAAEELVDRIAGALTDVSRLRFQAVFMMGAGGSGKGFTSARWMKYMPGGGEGYSREQMEKNLSNADYTEQERGLTNLNFEKAVARVKDLYGIDVGLEGNSARIPFRLYDYSPEGKREIPVSEWKNLPPDVYQEVKGLSEVVFSTPKHELPTYWRQINPDLYKEELAGYKEEQPGFVHDMSTDMAAAYFSAALETGDPLFVDGTGARLNKMEFQIKAAQKAGYKVSLVLVWVPLTINQIRNATRSRNVNPLVITAQWKAISSNFVKLRGLVDKSKPIDNRNDSNDLPTWDRKHEHINNFIKRETRGQYPDLYTLIKNEAPGEISQYGKILQAHRASP